MSDPLIEAAITFDATASPPTFTYFLDEDLKLDSSTSMMADGIPSKVYQVTVEATSLTVSVESEFDLTIYNPCLNSTITLEEE